ncbi:cytochrome bd-I ubiquinol oxidase subunit 2 apoprotein [Ruaniaceae bacterium KH17]|nr:cytochrome bd-I ubiquinol oxidase subunit 2 apoprotein [Ruaniaceae bacterium KH17]
MEWLSVLWFVLIAVLWIGYLTLEGFDFGVGMLLKWLPKNERERRVTLNSIGPHWDGNEVWLLTAGGAMFAAFPEWYATLFSGAYLALFVILLALIVRICAIEWRPKIRDEKWRRRWDVAHTISAWTPAVLWGVAFANLVQGMKIEVLDRATGAVVAPDAVASSLATSSHQLTGGFFSLITPYTLLGGLVTASLCLMGGAIFLALKTEGDIQRRAGDLAAQFSMIATVLAAIFVVWGQLAYSANAVGWIPLVIAALALVGTVVATSKRREGWAFLSYVVTMVAAVAWIFISMFPSVMKSSIDDAYSLTIAQASSTPYTLKVMSFVALGLVPVVLIYQGWTYWVFRKRISTKQISNEPAGLPLAESTKH